MEHLKAEHYMDFNWQMSFASGDFNVEQYLNSPVIQQMTANEEEYSRYRHTPMCQEVVDYWAQIGVTKEYYAKDIHEVSHIRDSHYYSVLHPTDMCGDQKLPLVYYCHGGGQEAFDGEISPLADRIAEEHFIYVCPNHYGADDFQKIVSEMQEKDYPIDFERIYVIGFSGGSGSALEISCVCPEMVAGVALIPGPNAFNQTDVASLLRQEHKDTPGLRVPLLCIGGTCDGGDRWPLADAISYKNLNCFMKNCVKLPAWKDITLEEAEKLHAGAAGVDQFFGMHFDRAYVNKENKGTEEYIYTGDYLDENGVAVARFVSIWGLPHGFFPEFAGIASAFMSKYRRLSDGSLAYDVPPVDFRTWRPVAAAEKEDKNESSI